MCNSNIYSDDKLYIENYVMKFNLPDRYYS